MEEIGQIFRRLDKQDHIENFVCCLAFVISKLEFPLNILKVSSEYSSKYIKGWINQIASGMTHSS